MSIIVHQPVLSCSGSSWRLEARCEGRCPPAIWYEGDGDPPSTELVGAAFLLPAVLRAMHVSEELDFKPVISELLAHRLEAAVMPLLAGFAPDILRRPVALKLPNIKRLKPTTEIGSATGMSCGLDSFASARELLQLAPGHSCRLACLSHFDTGNHDALRTGNPARLRAPRVARAGACSAEMGVPLVTIASNVSEWVPGDFARLHTLRNIAAAHVLTGVVRHYFYANGVRITQTSISARDTAYIDPLVVPLLSTEALQLHQSTPDLGAPEKVELIAGWDVARRHLNVCYFEDKNCGECEKCLRRMLLLDAAGVLREFAGVFPANALERQRSWYLGYVLARSIKSPVYAEIIEYLDKRNYRHLRPFRNRLAWLVRRICNRILRLAGRPRRPL